MTKTGQFNWTRLLDLIDERSVIPVVGRELLRVSVDGNETTIERALARKLIDELEELTPGDFSEEPDINEVAVKYLRSRPNDVSMGEQKRRLHKTLRRVYYEQDYLIPDTLRKLAGIEQFDLYISTTFDPLLGQALDEVRSVGEAQSVDLAYSTRREGGPPDIPSARGEPHVYRIFGGIESKTDFSITDEDHLERIHRLQVGDYPHNLFDTLREANLLFLGCGFPDGLARFFVRTLAGERLLAPEHAYQVADNRANVDSNLTFFLTSFGAQTYVAGDVAEFVSILAERCSELNGDSESQAVAEARSRHLSDDPSHPDFNSNYIFISYKREDLSRVLPIKQALQRANLPVWFDLKDTDPGEDWLLKQQKAIRKCTLFMPLISQQTQVERATVKREWNQALDLVKEVDPAGVFIVPVLLDSREDLVKDAHGEEEYTPPQFWRLGYVECLGGEPNPQLISGVRKRMQDVQVREAGR